ncbi:hypothetical protein [Paenibacillus woosongensis]|uniref:Uncharacterized protein n=1 Tax=Paenibacillus woosongensis TaxID=307580 RepID=A0ABQ4MUK3_9BACL|nr:hypothetical protein [Paenibacillus woosongensis]GIP59584.1 hypothetical protein J15TS10_33980 [Paenibacillus woosongensis]
MAWEQGGLFPKASEQEIQRTKFLLGKYTSMIVCLTVLFVERSMTG